ncbi:phage tail spike protein [Bacillus cytotoxicus]|uniref:Phage minor structural protein n=3 Tax=Bacillus cytotoxicus TaxID=580165 RepID=A0AAX2CJJ7_9BACI|nr:phage minor structural protein [Bacillus cytotoxicus NVH 391-98]SCL97856.1 Phage minor structural protein [Bacillus cytotoxicus]
MKMNGILHVVDFKTEQIVSAIQPDDYWDDKRHWELKNNVDTLDFTVFDNTKHAATLMQQNLVLKEVRDGHIVPYVITEIEKNSNNRSVTVYASGEWILLAKAGYIMPQRIESKTVNEFIDMALPGTKWKRGRTEYAGFHTMTIDEPISPLKFLKDIASLFDLEIVYRCEVAGSQVVGRYVDMVKRRGRVTGKEVTLGKDLKGIVRRENSQNICTALFGFVRGENEKIITVENINNGLPYIVDNDAFQRWSENGQHKFGFYTPETEDLNMTDKRLMTLMEIELKKRINSSVSYEVDAQDISRVLGLAHEEINEGDTIRIKDTGFTPKLYLEARAIAADESFTDPTQDKYVFGDYREIVDPNEELRKLYNKIRGSLGSKANKELLEQLEKLAEQAKGEAEQAIRESQAAKDLSEKLKENIEQNMVEIIESANPPTTNLKPNKTLWRDINGRPGILKIWTGAVWETVAPDIEPLKQEIESTKTELNKKVEVVQNEQGEVNQKIVEMEKTNVGFKTSIEELTKQGNEIGDKVNTIEHTVEGTQQTITDIQSTTDTLTKTTNEMKQTVDTNSSTIQKVQQDQSIISKDVTQVKQAVGSLETTVKNVTEAQTEQGQVISQQSSQIKQLSNEVSSKVTAKQVEEYIGGIGSQNKLINAIFTEKKIDDRGNELSKTPSYKGWKVYSGAGGIVQPDSSLTKDNDYTIKVQVSDQPDNKYYGISQTIPCQPGEQLVASVYIYTKDKSVIDQSGALELKFNNGSTHIKQFSKEFEFVNHNWVRIVLPVTAPNEPITQVEFRLQLRRNGEIWFAHPMLQNGTKPSSFFPNPKDLTNYQETLDKLADKVATEEFNKKTTELSSAIEQTNESIKSKVEKTEVYTKEQANEQFATNAYVKTMESVIEQNAEEINLRVKSGEIAAALNMTHQQVLINANKINLVGHVTAQHIKGQVLEGVKLKTSADPQTGRYIEISQRNIFFYDDKNEKRVYLGFYNRPDGGLQPTFMLGRGAGDADKLSGTMALTQIVPKINGQYDYSRAVGQLEMITYYNANENAFSSDNYIRFWRQNSGMTIFAAGQLLLESNNLIDISTNWTHSEGKNIQLKATRNFYAEAHNVVDLRANNGFFFPDSKGQWIFPKKDLNPGKNSIAFFDNGSDADLRLAYIRIRSSHIHEYSNKVQFIRSGDSSTKYAPIEIGALRIYKQDNIATGNIWAEGKIYSEGSPVTSSKKLKTNIRDVDFSPLEKVMSLELKQYNRKHEIPTLYKMRENKPSDKTEPYTINDIRTEYGFIADYTDEVFKDDEVEAIELYALSSISAGAIKELNIKLEQEKKELQNRITALEDLVQKLINEKTEQQ